MPCSWSAPPAGCIFGLSFLDPMMIPTRGASTSISSNAASTSGMGSITSVSVDPGSDTSKSRSPVGWGCSAGGDRYRARGDVGAHLPALEVDDGDALIGAVSRRRRVRAEPGVLGYRVEPPDHVALRGARRIPGAGEHDGDRPILGEVHLSSGESAGLA